MYSHGNDKIDKITSLKLISALLTDFINNKICIKDATIDISNIDIWKFEIYRFKESDNVKNIKNNILNNIKNNILNNITILTLLINLNDDIIKNNVDIYECTIYNDIWTISIIRKQPKTIFEKK